MSQDKEPAVDLTEKTLEERLEAHGFLTIKDAGPDTLDQAVKDFAQDYWTIPEASTKDVYRSAVLKLLKGVVSAPARLIDGALADAKPEDAEAVESGYTESSNVIDLLSTEDEKSYLIDGPEIVTDIGAEDGWSRDKIESIWVLPKQELVKGYLDRLSREVQMRQSVYDGLMQAYDQARIQEVRNTPVITVLERPVAPVTREPRGRIRAALLGLILGSFLGLVLILAKGFSVDQSDPDILALKLAWEDTLQDIYRFIPGRRTRS